MNLFNDLNHIIELANQEVLSVYDENFDVETKSDDSPVTDADRRANDVIFNELRKLDSTIPVVSEESHIPEFDVRASWRRYWLVDPLDGTKDFVSRRGYFTVNIALVEENEPRVGIVSWPIEQINYYGDTQENTAFLIGKDGKKSIRTREISSAELNVIMSFRRGQVRCQRFLDKLSNRFNSVNTEHISSSLKLCRIADQRADLYPQFDGTSEWDTAAGQAVLEAAGGRVILLNGDPLRYNTKQELLNPPFFALGTCGDDYLSYFLQCAADS